MGKLSGSCRRAVGFWSFAVMLGACCAAIAGCCSRPSTPVDVPRAVAVVDVDGQKVDVEHHDGTFNGLTIHYVTAGPASGKKVLLLHGFPEFWYGWRYQIAALARGGYRVYAPDLRGYDLSSKPQGKENYTIAKVAADIVAMIRDISPSQKISVVGHDWGGSVTFRMAYDHADLFDKIFILNIPHPNQIKDVFRDPLGHLGEAVGMLYIGAFAPKGQPEFLFKDLLGFKESFDLFIYRPMVHKEFVTDEDRRIIYDSWGKPGALTAASDYYRVNGDFPKTFPDKALPASLPVILLFGMKDIFMAPSYAARIDECRVCAENLTVYRIEDASHFVHSDVPRKVNEILLQHLR
ncbi:MAG TPA: alpha/beta hydrolase [Polyangiaceae bacterium]|nr:alpha/beta hydrolase [Polyangiaceae bacterium]